MWPLEVEENYRLGGNGDKQSAGTDHGVQPHEEVPAANPEQQTGRGAACRPNALSAAHNRINK